MRRIVSIGLVVALCSLTMAPTGWMTAQAADSQHLPKYRTADELLLGPTTVPPGLRSVPSGVVRCPAEYERCEGILFSWEQGYQNDILTEMTVIITNNDPEAIVWMVVDTAALANSVSTTLSNAGADMSQVEMIVRNCDSIWIRDYGPRFIFDDGQRSIIDHTYYTSRPNDNAFNDYLASYWGIPEHQLPLVHGGGNFHNFADGDAFMSQLIVNDNPGYTAQQIKDLYAQYQGVNLTIFPQFPFSYDGTGHIDMWMLPVDTKEVIIGQYPTSAGTPYTITENAVDDLEARGYTVYRTPGWNTGGTHFTYTNAIILNDLVLMPVYNHANDAAARATFQAAYDDKTIFEVDCVNIIPAAGAMHCICMHVPAYDPIPNVRVTAPNGGEQIMVGTTYDITWVATDDLGVTGIDIYYSTDGGVTYPNTIATGEPNDGVFTWTVPPPLSDTLRIKVVATDADMNTAEDESDDNFAIIIAPDLIHSFSMDTDPGWDTEGLWAFGTPTGGGSHRHDPTSGYTGGYVYGYNLFGDYQNNRSYVYSLTTTPIDCTDINDAELRFQRWLGVERFDGATIEVSNDGVYWTTVWENPAASNVNDGSWSLQTYDISAVADGQSSVQIRWTMGPTDLSTSFPGWNIDDVQIWAVVDADFTDCLTGPDATTYDAGCSIYDFDVDGDIDLVDFGFYQLTF